MNRNEYFEEINTSKYLTLVPTNESQEKIKKNMKNCGVKSEIQLGQQLNDEKHMKVKFNPDDELPLNTTIEIPSITIVVRATFHENDKYYPQVFLDEHEKLK